MSAWDEKPEEDEGPPQSFARAEEGNHIAGPYYGLIQRCIVCGGVIVDDRNACYPVGQKASKGFPEGEVSIRGNMTSRGHDEDLESCKPL